VLRASTSLIFVSLLLGACSGSGGSANPSATLEVAGPTPSATASMVCATEARGDIASAIGLDAIRVSKPTWDVTRHVLSCTYDYADAARMVLTVKELSSAHETTSFYDGEAASLGRTRSLEIGDAAFRTTDGSLVVRKDYKVLVIDVSDLSASFGKPPTARATVAVNIATVVMLCWKGA
jgi:hypothetical protein